MHYSFAEAVADSEEIARKLIAGATKASAAQLGLDPRAGYDSFMVGDDFIAIPKGYKRVCEYYGGFEYVDRDCVFEFGDWVFYTVEDSRIHEHLDIFMDIEPNEDDA